MLLYVNQILILRVFKKLKTILFQEDLHDIPIDYEHLIWQSIGSQPLYKFNTQALTFMCFPDFFNVKGGPTVTSKQR